MENEVGVGITDCFMDCVGQPVLVRRERVQEGAFGIGRAQRAQLSHPLGRVAVRAGRVRCCLAAGHPQQQIAYRMTEAVAFAPDDRLSISCEWDNSAENQPIIDGAVRAPQDVAWGEGTFDEMCLGVVYVSR